MKHTARNFGFTLIELLIVILVIVVLSTIGLATYINFNRNQLVTQTARTIAQDMMLAQSMAENSQKPASCPTLQSYIFSRPSASTTSYSIYVKCLNALGTPMPTPSIKPTTTLPAGLTLSGFNSVEFKVLRGGIETSPIIGVGVGNTSTLSVTGYTNIVRTITVSKGGTISVSGE